MSCLHNVLTRLEKLNTAIDDPGSSVLLHELAMAETPSEAVGSPHDTPILNAMTAAHSYVMMFIHVCRTGQVIHRNVRNRYISKVNHRTKIYLLFYFKTLYSRIFEICLLKNGGPRKAFLF